MSVLTAPATEHLAHPGPRDGRVAPPEVRLLDGFEVVVAGAPVTLPPAAARLVAYLALHGRPVTRTRVAGALWADSTEDRAAACLRSAMWRANGGGFRMVRGRTEIALADALVDARELAGAAHRLLSGGPPVDFPGLGGELLPGWEDEWVVVERERLRVLCLEAMDVMARDLLAAGDHRRAVEAAAAVLATEPLRESAHQVLVEAHLAAGNRAAALRQFEVCRQLLDRELGLSPAAPLVAAAARARGELMP